MAITKSDLRVIELVIGNAKAETQKQLVQVEAAHSESVRDQAEFYKGRIDGYSRALHLIKEEFEEGVK